VLLTQGVPEIIIADNGSQFVSKEFKFWKNALYHPQNNPTGPTAQSKQL
jgi:hypothetical protein